jgi:putative chitinase
VQGITEEQFKQIFPNYASNNHVPLSPADAEAKAQAWTAAINQAMQEANINTPERRAAFLAEAAEETAWGDTLTEYADGSEYEGRTDLGNVNPGDGPRYKGRGGLQLTGRSNYSSAGKALGLDLVGNPDQVASDPVVGWRTAGGSGTTALVSATSTSSPIKATSQPSHGQSMAATTGCKPASTTTTRS